MYHALIQQMSDSLGHFANIMKKAEAHANEQGMSPEDLLNARLAEDMFSFTRQVQSMSDTAKFTAARLSGKEAPSFADEETTFAELYERLEKTIAYLDGFSAEDFDGSDERRISLPFAKDFYAPGADYFRQFSLPNFFFHLTTGYAILRHMGVPIGKRDFIGSITMLPIEE